VYLSESCACDHDREELDEEAEEEGHEERASAEGPANSGEADGSAVRSASTCFTPHQWCLISLHVNAALSAACNVAARVRMSMAAISNLGNLLRWSCAETEISCCQVQSL
jgi:hypothetical protein